MISTTEAEKVESPKGTEVTEEQMAAEMMPEEQGDGDSLQTISITLEQLEQLKASGSNIIYVVRLMCNRMLSRGCTYPHNALSCTPTRQPV